MSSGSRWLSLVFVAGALVTPLVTTGCGGHRVYDPYYSDYHRWDNHETVYYQQWETEGHRDHREFNQRNNDEQKDYWNWRHQHDHH